MAVRLSKKDVDAVGVSDGDLVKVEIQKVRKGGALDLGSLPTFKDKDSRASVRHDEYLYG